MQHPRQNGLPSQDQPPSQSVTDFFDKQADSYSAFFDPNTRTGAAVLFQLRRRIALELLRDESPRSLLDIATGTGEISLAVASSQQLQRVHLNDISPGMLKTCQRLFEERMPALAPTWSNDDVFELLAKQDANQFDLILCLGLIAHTGRLHELLGRIYAYLRPGGVLLLQSSLTDHLGARATALFARSPLRRTRYRVSAYSKNDILAATAKAGFELVGLRRYGLCVPFGDRALGRLNHRLERMCAEKMSDSGGDALFKLRKPT